MAYCIVCDRTGDVYHPGDCPSRREEEPYRPRMGHGGHRSGAGRRNDGDQKRLAVSVSLDPEHLMIVDTIAAGYRDVSRSEIIRMLLDKGAKVWRDSDKAAINYEYGLSDRVNAEPALDLGFSDER